eukprot:TRINITY_DN9463_c0_g1_i1.p1 TRINITY_DN9463_c0_g1~~TRINITY_DN9463_c0_g1_i1.p1  ORF type:complete len:527 (+),score=157.16 TRINITY_DN9463_c0_g1_i1:18-1598(+)
MEPSPTSDSTTQSDPIEQSPDANPTSVPKKDESKTQPTEAIKDSSTGGSNIVPALSITMPLSQEARKRKVEDFTFESVLGTGAFAEVKLAIEKETGTKYAIKVLLKEHIKREKKTKYVTTERDILNRMKNPYIIMLYYTFQDVDHLYFAFEHCPNGDLRSAINKNVNFNDDCTRFYSAEILSGLKYLHKAKIQHRDLKPENILFDSNMHIKLIDFGTSRLIINEQPKENLDDSLDPRKKKRDSFVGTAEYVSPELLNDLPSNYSADLWAFGCIVYQMSTGRPPFSGGTEYNTFQLVLGGNLFFPLGLPETIQDLIKKILVQDANERLGANGNYSEVESHPFFAETVWERLEKQTPPELASRGIVFEFPPMMSKSTGDLIEEEEKAIAIEKGVLSAVPLRSLSCSLSPPPSPIPPKSSDAMINTHIRENENLVRTSAALWKKNIVSNSKVNLILVCSRADETIGRLLAVDRSNTLKFSVSLSPESLAVVEAKSKYLTIQPLGKGSQAKFSVAEPAEWAADINKMLKC